MTHTDRLSHQSRRDPTRRRSRRRRRGSLKTGRQALTNHARRSRGDWPRRQLRAPGGQLRCQRGDWVIGHRDGLQTPVERLHRTSLDDWTTGWLGVSGTHPSTGKQGPSGSIQLQVRSSRAARVVGIGGGGGGAGRRDARGSAVTVTVTVKVTAAGKRH